MTTEVYDIETIINLFTYTGYCLQDNTFYQFAIHKDCNDIEKLYNHLKRDKEMMQIGYNNEAFDYPVLHYFLSNYNKFKDDNPENVAKKLYDKAQEIIKNNNLDVKVFSTIRDKDKFIIQLDLFLIWHYNNKAKLTSLKDLEFAMNMSNIEDMPIHHSTYCNYKDIKLVLDYNKNDVEATILFLNATLGNTDYSIYKGKNKIQLRLDLQREYGLNCLNFNDVKIGEQLLLKLYCDKLQLNKWDISKLRTKRPIIEIKDCIPSYSYFTTTIFNNQLIEPLKKIVIYDGILKDVFNLSVIYNGIKIDYGAGGAHACIKSGVYKEDDEYVIMDVDIDGMYPSVEITQGIYPEHLGPEFIEILDKEIVAPRKVEKKKPKKERKFTIVEGFKLCANGSYGKSNEKNSFLYDPLYTLKTTIPGQIVISMWIESICENIPNIQIIQVNTDGWTFKIKKEYIDEAIKLSDELMNITGLTYETSYYKQMIIRDVNNYIGEYTDNSPENEHIKFKGCFEIDKEFHKDTSMKIISIALKEYFINNIPIEQTIRNHQNIYDFCLRLKINSSSIAQYNFINNDNRLDSTNLTRTTRYFISNKGGALTVYYNGKENPNKINKGFVCTLFNKFYESDNYNINYNFYEIETRKIINAIEDFQSILF